MRKRLGLKILGATIFELALAGLAVMLLWNAVVVWLAPVKSLGYLQAIGLLLLVRILTSNFLAGKRADLLKESWHRMPMNEREKMLRHAWRHFHRRENWSEDGPQSDGQEEEGHGRYREKNCHHSLEVHGRSWGSEPEKKTEPKGPDGKNGLAPKRPE
ncbi:MAG: hypothetical protein LBV23_04220 [Deltaproteobacteria bacterium]|nr:hypothetical protein [Deltaproteobacteria bacterium]